jgi:hypothetical protein
MERALALLVQRGAGRDAAVLQNNLAIARYPLEGPARSLREFEHAIVFAQQRGLGESVALLEASCPTLLAELGRPEEALERAERLAPVLEAQGASHPLAEVRSVELATRLACGERATRAEADWLVEAARAIRATDIVVMALASAAAVYAVDAPGGACGALEELEQARGTYEVIYYARQLPAMVRTALGAGNPALGKRLAAGLEPRYPLDHHALCATRAQLAEQAGEQAEAVKLYAEAEARWHEFGNVPERAYALLGQGRSLVALRDAASQEPLREARGLFTSMAYKPALAETEALLEQTAPAPAG